MFLPKPLLYRQTTMLGTPSASGSELSTCVWSGRQAYDVPPLLFAELDTLNDDFQAAFINYPGSEKIVVVDWATTGELNGMPIDAFDVHCSGQGLSRWSIARAKRSAAFHHHEGP